MTPEDIQALLAEADKFTDRGTGPGAWPKAALICCLASALRGFVEENERLRSAIIWALGEGDSDFGEHMPEPRLMPDGSTRVAPYWWRTELRRRAATLTPPKDNGHG